MKKKKETGADFSKLYQKINELHKKSDKSILPVSEREKRIERSKVDPEFFYKTYLPHHFPSKFTKHHLEIPEYFKFKQQPVVIITPRGSGKSTLILAETIRLLVTGLQKFLIRIEVNEDVACNEILSVQNELETNERLIADFGNMKGKSQWTALELTLSNGSKLWGRGIDQPVRGLKFQQWRPTGIIYNDVEKQDQALSEDQSDNILKKLLNEALPSLSPKELGGGFLAVVGTLLSKKAMLAQIAEHPWARTIKYPAIQGHAEDIEMVLMMVSEDSTDIGKYCSSFNTDSEEDKQSQRNYFRLNPKYIPYLKKLKSYWPEVYPIEELLLIASISGTSAFKQEYLHITTDDLSGDLFPEHWFFRPQNQMYIDEIPQQNLIRAIALDPSHKEGKTNDSKAFVIGVYSVDECVGYVIDIIEQQMSYQDMVHMSFELTREYLLGDMKLHQEVNGEYINVTIPKEAFIDEMFVYENNGAQGWLDTVFNENASKYQFRLPRLTGVLHTGNKNARIAKLSLPIGKSILKMDSREQSIKRVITELRKLEDRKVHDDGADALEMWWSVINRPNQEITFFKSDSNVTQDKWFGRRTKGFREPFYKSRERERYNSILYKNSYS